MRPFFAALALLLLIAPLSSLSLAQQDSDSHSESVSTSVAPGTPDLSDMPCHSAEACYHAAFTTEDVALSPQDRALRKIELLRLVPLREPESVWAKRALVLIGLLLIETDSTSAVRQLEASQPDWPLLDDYVRLWTGEALLRQGEASQAAVLFESIVIAFSWPVRRFEREKRGTEQGNARRPLTHCSGALRLRRRTRLRLPLNSCWRTARHERTGSPTARRRIDICGFAIPIRRKHERRLCVCRS